MSIYLSSHTHSAIFFLFQSVSNLPKIEKSRINRTIITPLLICVLLRGSLVQPGPDERETLAQPSMNVFGESLLAGGGSGSAGQSGGE